MLAAMHVLKLGAVSEIDRPAGDASPPQGGRGLPSAKRDIAQHADLYKVAYQEAQRALDDQQGELRSMRDRSVQFTAFIGAATAFLVGTGLHPAHRDVPFYILAGTASALTVALILLLLLLLTPSKRRYWYYRLSAKKLIKDSIETEVPPPTEAHFIRALALRYDGMRVENEKLLGALRRYYRWLIVVGIVQITVWATLVWVKA
jgi:hypothetical protein